MLEYTFKVGSLYFKIQSEEDKEAVTKARRALEESAPVDTNDYIELNLTAGAYLGRLYIEPGEITVHNICRKIPLPEPEVGVPF